MEKTSKKVALVALVFIIVVIVLLVNAFTKNDLPKADGTVDGSMNQEDYIADYTDTKVTSDIWYGMLEVDLKGLQKVNPDTVGWLYIENTDVSYPIMYSGDDKKYLHTDFNGAEANAGAIFLEGENSSDFNDRHTLIYGHNMKNESMFGSLKNYKSDESYYDDHQYFQVITVGEDGSTIKYRYHIFAYKDVSVNDDVYYVLDENSTEMDKFIYNELKNNSLINVSVPSDTDQHVITLSTCTTSDNNRFVVSAIRCGECVIK
ncbi:MAG: class B sortase [Lachnospiraceae bacterium]|nr:class B sortase [Lachnospiraceae bacterium]